MTISSLAENKFLNGQVILINKPIGWTSFDVVKNIKYIIKKTCKIKKIKVGHAGTLDPLATGLLIVCTGKFTKIISKIQNMEKTYVGTITLGESTPSYDLETKVDKKHKTSHITESLVYQTTKKFLGEIQQTPPVYSAIKQNGERLYQKARRGESVIIKNRKVFVKRFEILSIDQLNINFEIECSKGTYIRSIANDFGLKLNSGSHLRSLCRTKIGKYKLTNALTPKEFEKILIS